MNGKHAFTAIGISFEGETLRVAAVTPDDLWLRVTALQKFKVSSPAVTSQSDDGVETVGSEPIEITDFSGIDSPMFNSSDTVSKYADGVPPELMQISEMIMHGGNRIGLAIADPHIYYHQIEDGTRESAEKLIRRVQKEVITARENVAPPERDAIGIINLSDGKKLAVVREQHLTLFKDFEKLRLATHSSASHISFVESADTALINLVGDRQPFQPGEQSLILHVGDHSSRFIFMNGAEIAHISQSLGVNDETPSVVSVLYSRLMFEMDTNMLPPVERVVLTGYAAQEKYIEYFTRNLSQAISVSGIDIIGLGNSVLLDTKKNILAPYAVAMGAALQALDPKNKNLLKLDLTPGKIRERRNKFSLSKLGWVLLFLIPLVTFGLIREIAHLNKNVSRLHSELTVKQAAAAQTPVLQSALDSSLAVLTKTEKALAVIDTVRGMESSMAAQLQTMCDALAGVSGVWITDAASLDGGKMQLKGYSLRRGAIPLLQQRLAPADLKIVEAKEIRDHNVYSFEMETEPADSVAAGEGQ